jgi:hypothetical protein
VITQGYADEFFMWLEERSSNSERIVLINSLCDLIEQDFTDFNIRD